jgi:hypothetical protein
MEKLYGGKCCDDERQGNELGLSLDPMTPGEAMHLVREVGNKPNV